MDKGTAMRGTYKKFSLDEKAGIAKCTAEYRVSFTTVQHIVKIWPDHPLKEVLLTIGENFLLENLDKDNS